jgi:NitT/TauT family transport system ATP-binding protein
VITSTELPDVVVSTVASSIVEEAIEPLPSAKGSDVLALLDYLAARSGSADLFLLASQTQTPFDRMVRVVKAAEMLDLVDTPRRLVILTSLGQRFAAAPPAEQRRLWCEGIMQLRLFKVTRQLMELRGGELSKKELLQEISNRLPTEDPETTFETLVAWARFGGLFNYSEEQGQLTPHEALGTVA